MSPMAKPNDRGQRIRKARGLAGLSQHGLAVKVGVTDLTVRNWEKGRFAPSGNHVAPLADALGVTVRWLLTGDEAAA